MERGQSTTIIINIIHPFIRPSLSASRPTNNGNNNNNDNNNLLIHHSGDILTTTRYLKSGRLPGGWSLPRSAVAASSFPGPARQRWRFLSSSSHFCFWPAGRLLRLLLLSASLPLLIIWEENPLLLVAGQPLLSGDWRRTKECSPVRMVFRFLRRASSRPRQTTRIGSIQSIVVPSHK